MKSSGVEHALVSMRKSTRSSLVLTHSVYRMQSDWIKSGDNRALCEGVELISKWVNGYHSVIRQCFSWTKHCCDPEKSEVFQIQVFNT